MDKHGSISSRFQFTCRGSIGTTRRFSLAKTTQLLMERGRVNMPVEDICKGGKIRVAWNEMPGWFDVDTKDNKMVQFDYPNSKPMHTSHLTYPHEILTSFMIEHQLSPIYLNNFRNPGEWNRRGGMWWGAAAMVRLLLLLNIS